ncbi:MAG: PQQ-like beta-propeller repeat protein, partial [Planctomycetes bacterium]|nr:PQQ-like beta-propeller repeat protein [Planctomycetota bacterium]
MKGLNAVSPKASEGTDSPPRLEKGPAFGSPPAVSTDRSAHDWPTYRCNPARSDYQDVAAPRQLTLAWKAQLTPPLTAPVVAGGRVFVAETNRHALYALSAAGGKLLWTFIADGRIDSPPTVSAGRCLFGTRGGYVYCLRTSDGALMWRFRAAPQDRRLFSYGQLESVWPV